MALAEGQASRQATAAISLAVMDVEQIDYEGEVWIDAGLLLSCYIVGTWYFPFAVDTVVEYMM